MFKGAVRHVNVEKMSHLNGTGSVTALGSCPDAQGSLVPQLQSTRIHDAALTFPAGTLGSSIVALCWNPPVTYGGVSTWRAETS